MFFLSLYVLSRLASQIRQVVMVRREKRCAQKFRLLSLIIINMDLFDFQLAVLNGMFFHHFACDVRE